jgi:lipopolysaccharide biosynthesis glycosyltransferase
MLNQPMTIVSAADECFVPHFAAMLHSAWTHHPSAEFLLLDCGVEPSSLAALTTYAVKQGIHFRVVKVDITLLHGLPTAKYWSVETSVATYARLLIPDLLPKTIERTLYLDADCIVVSDLTALWQMDMGQAAIAGTADVGIAQLERKNGIELDEDEYVNAGVLLMNLAVWRRDRLAAAAMAFINQHQPSFLDQTGINAACAGKIRQISDDWNFIVGAGWRTLEEWRKPPRIIHCTGPYRPWDYRDVPFGAIYAYHRNQTPFPLDRLRLDTSRSPLRRALNLLIGRRKYWNQLIIARRSQAFARAYFTRIARAGLVAQ